ncbi:hypothetical protein Tco_0469230 [Tanacetum coccineum]
MRKVSFGETEWRKGCSLSSLGSMRRLQFCQQSTCDSDSICIDADFCLSWGRRSNSQPRKRLLLTTPRPGCEVGESSAAAAARLLGPTIETRLRDTERRMMTTLEMVNMRVSYQVDVRSRESSEFYTRHHDAQKDRAAVRAKIEILRRERLAYKQEILETEVHRHEWQRQTADDLAVQYIMRTQALEAGARVDTLEDTGSSS